MHRLLMEVTYQFFFPMHDWVRKKYRLACGPLLDWVRRWASPTKPSDTGTNFLKKK
jgi:hypothetical protein